MEIENNKEEVPFSYYEEKFSQADPAEVVSRLGSLWDGEAFTVTLLGRQFRITHPVYAITACDGGPLPPLPAQTFLLRYLLEGTQTPWQGSWKTFREMPWGELYIKPYTGRVLTRAAYTFGTRLAAFRAAAEKMGATPISHGDAGFTFALLPGCFMQLIAWAPDEEFPPNAQVLYSDNFAAFAAEDRVVAGDILISTVKSFM